MGPLEPRLEALLGRRNIELVPAIYAKDVARLVSAMQEERPGLTLIGRRTLRSNNSWMHNSPQLTAGKNRCVLLMHPEDALERNIDNGSVVDVASSTGRIAVAVALTDDVMPGVVSLPHGFGHQEHVASGLRHAKTVAGPNANRLTSVEAYDRLSGTAALSGQVVHVSRLPQSTED